MESVGESKLDYVLRLSGGDVEKAIGILGKPLHLSSLLLPVRVVMLRDAPHRHTTVLQTVTHIHMDHKSFTNPSTFTASSLSKILCNVRQ